jgi:hypothetical protein
MVIWYIFPRFGMLYQEKTGNPSWNQNEAPFKVPETPRFVKRCPSNETRDRIFGVEKKFLGGKTWFLKYV